MTLLDKTFARKGTREVPCYRLQINNAHAIWEPLAAIKDSKGDGSHGAFFIHNWCSDQHNLLRSFILSP